MSLHIALSPNISQDEVCMKRFLLIPLFLSAFSTVYASEPKRFALSDQAIGRNN